jgi:hypothetical protein
MEQLQDRLSTIESNLGHLAGTMTRNKDSCQSSASASLRQGSTSGLDGGSSLADDNHNNDADDDDDEDDDDEDEDDGGGEDGNNENSRGDSRSRTNSIQHEDSRDTHIFRNRVDMADRYHGLSSLFVACNRFRVRVLSASNAAKSAPLQDMLQQLCEISGQTESFPSSNEQGPIQLLPKHQAIAAVDQFFQHLDYSTDLFVRSNLLAKLESIYAHPMDPGNDVWAVCFRVITLLALGMEISCHASNALLGDFARSLLPSRAGLVNSRLLTTPRLINVQTLILLV